MRKLCVPAALLLCLAAIACAGFRTNDTPANLGAADAVPLRWAPVRL